MISKEHLNALIYSGPEAEKHLYLYHHDNHYDVITSMPAFLARKMYCHKCKKGFDKITDHPCGDLCKLCHTQNSPLVEWKFCKNCSRFFKSEACFDRHKDDAGPAKSLCRALVKCKKCKRVVTRASLRDHHCGKVRCSTCQKYVKPENHQCYLQPVKAKKTQTAEKETICSMTMWPWIMTWKTTKTWCSSTLSARRMMVNTSPICASSRTKAVTRKSFLAHTLKTSSAHGYFKRKTRIRRLSRITSRLTMGTLFFNTSIRMVSHLRLLLVAQKSFPSPCQR